MHTLAFVNITAKLLLAPILLPEIVLLFWHCHDTLTVKPITHFDTIEGERHLTERTAQIRCF